MNAESDPMILKACADPLVAASFQEFADLDEEAADLEIAPPCAEVKAAAKRILAALVQEFPRYYMVFPDENGEVAIETIGEKSRILVVCDESGVACFVTADEKSRRVRYDKEAARTFPDEFIRSALRELE